MLSLKAIVPAIALVLFFAIRPDASCAQDSVDAGASHSGVVAYIGDVLGDTATIISSPPDWDASDWTEAAFVAGTALALYACDGEIRDVAQSNRTVTGDEISGVFRLFGDKHVILPALGAALVVGDSLENGKLKKTALTGLESFLITSIFTETIKMSTHRHRPDEDNKHDEWDGPGMDRTSSHMSFPSGHAASAFSAASVVASAYGERPYVAATAYTLATLAALSRINEDEHWASDAFFGSALGYFTGKAVARLNDKRKGGFRVFPLPSEDGGMIILSYGF